VLLATGLIFAAVPMITIFPIIGARFGEERPCAAALTAATLAAFLTVPLVLASLAATGLVALD
jgi:malonate transporter and related proteins